MLQHLSKGRTDRRSGAGRSPGCIVVRPGHSAGELPLAWRTTTVDGCGVRMSWTAGEVRTSPQGFMFDPATPGRRARPSYGTADPHAVDRQQAAYDGDGFFANNIFWPKEHYIRLIRFYRQRYAHYGHGTEKQAIVGLGGQAYIARNSQDAKREFRPYFSEAPVYGHGPTMEDFMDATPLSVGSPQEVIDKNTDVPRALRRLPAPAVPDGPRRAAAQDGARSARPARRRGHPGAPEGDRGPARPADAGGTDAPKPDQGEVRRDAAASAAPECEPRRQRHRPVARTRTARRKSRPSTRSCDDRRRATSERRMGSAAVRARRADQAVRGRRYLGRAIDARIRRAVHAVQMPRASAHRRPEPPCPAQSACAVQAGAPARRPGPDRVSAGPGRRAQRPRVAHRGWPGSAAPGRPSACTQRRPRPDRRTGPQ